MTDEEYVRSVWYSGSVMSLARISIDGDWEWFDSWSAAAEFTRERLEQVRQLREEIAFQRESSNDAMRFFVREAAAHWPGNDMAETIQSHARRMRTRARLESALARLTAGMKPEATA